MSSTTQSLKGKEEKPLSYLQSEALRYRIMDAEWKRWKRKEWTYKYIFLPCTTSAFFVIIYLIYFSKEYEPTEEQLEHLKTLLDRAEARKRLEVPTDSNKPSSS